MKKQTVLTLAAVAAVLTVAAMLFVGCDTQSADNPLTIDPASVHLGVGESQEFTVSGGFDYTWTLSNESLGDLDTRTGDRVTYTSGTESSNSTQTITVTSTIEGTAGSGSNSASYQATAQAIVYPIDYSAPDPTTTPTAVGITPPSATMGTNGESRVFQAYGGDGSTYSWSLNNSTIGSLDASSGESVQYTSTHGGTQTLYVVSGELSSSATIIQH